MQTKFNMKFFSSIIISSSLFHPSLGWARDQNTEGRSVPSQVLSFVAEQVSYPFRSHPKSAQTIAVAPAPAHEDKSLLDKRLRELMASQIEYMESSAHYEVEARRQDIKDAIAVKYGEGEARETNVARLRSGLSDAEAKVTTLAERYRQAQEAILASPQATDRVREFVRSNQAETEAYLDASRMMRKLDSESKMVTGHVLTELKYANPEERGMTNQLYKDYHLAQFWVDEGAKEKLSKSKMNVLRQARDDAKLDLMMHLFTRAQLDAKSVTIQGMKFDEKWERILSRIVDTHYLSTRQFEIAGLNIRHRMIERDERASSVVAEPVSEKRGSSEPPTDVSPVKRTPMISEEVHTVIADADHWGTERSVDGGTGETPAKPEEQRSKREPSGLQETPSIKKTQPSSQVGRTELAKGPDDFYVQKKELPSVFQQYQNATKGAGARTFGKSQLTIEELSKLKSRVEERIKEAQIIRTAEHGRL